MEDIELLENELNDAFLERATRTVVVEREPLKRVILKYKRLDKDNNDLVRLYKRIAIKLKENGKEELADFFLAQIGIIPVFTVTDDIDYYSEYYKLKKENEKYKEMYAQALAKGMNESIQSANKNNTELNLLNEGWKSAIREKQIQREYELQQKYKDFEKDSEWLRYQELLEGK